MKVVIISTLLVCLFIAGCGDDRALQEAQAEASRWRMLAIVGTIGAIFIGIAMGSRGKS